MAGLHEALGGEMREDIAIELLGFGRHDLLCYRAVEPDALIVRQHAQWTPLLDWVHETHGARLTSGHGVNPVAQDPGAMTALPACTARTAATESSTTTTCACLR